MYEPFDYIKFRMDKKVKKLFDTRKISWIKFLALAQLLDLLTTIVAISFIGAWEGNPVMANFSIFQMSFAKIIVAYVLVLTAVSYVVNLPLWSIKIFSIVSFLPVIWNTFVIAVELLY